MSLLVIPIQQKTKKAAPQSGERSNAASRTQSAANLPSHAAHDSKARLIVLPKRRGSWRSHVHRTRFRRLSSSSRSRLPMGGDEGKGPSSLSLGGCKGGCSLSSEREHPPLTHSRAAAGTMCSASRCQKSRLSAKKKERLFRGALLICAKVRFTDTSACRRWRGRGRRRRRW